MLQNTRGIPFTFLYSCIVTGRGGGEMAERAESYLSEGTNFRILSLQSSDHWGGGGDWAPIDQQNQ